MRLGLLKLVWTLAVLSLSVFWVSVAHSDGETHSLLSALMLLATFPIGLLWAATLNVAAYFSMLTQLGDIGLVVFACAGFLVFGYVQWFVAVPRLWGWLKSSRFWSDRPNRLG